MARLECSRNYVGAVDHPTTGELIQLDEPQPSDIADAVANAYPYVSIASDEAKTDATDANSNEEGEEPDYAEMDYAELRQLAANADTDEINGRSSKADIVAYFTSK